MKIKKIVPFRPIAAALVILAFLAPAAAARDKVKLPAFYQKWLDEDVAYIISSLEREVFLKLQSDRERNSFIEAFWKRRDPAPLTPENEFKIEHDRRIAYANKYYGRTAPKPGWKTDRGRMYIILGEPNDVQRFYGKMGVYDLEIWFYQQKSESAAAWGLPPGFNLMFFQEGSASDFKLYSPTTDGPMALMTDYRGDPTDYADAYQALRDIDNTIATASVSLIPGEGLSMVGRPQLTSDLLLNKIETIAAERIDDQYAAKFLEFKDVVDVEYSANFLDSDGSAAVISDPSGPAFVHYMIEPGRLSVEPVGEEFITRLLVNGTVSTTEGKPIYQFEKTATIRFDKTRLGELGRVPFAFQDLFPLLPGSFKLSVLLKNESSKEFCSFERSIVVPGSDAGAGMTAPLLGFRSAPADPARATLKPFQFGSIQVYVQASRVLTKSDPLVLAFQVLGLDEASRSRARLRFEITKEGQPVKDWERDLAGYAEIPNVVESVPAADFAPAIYDVKVLLLVDGREIASTTQAFALSYQENIPRPWIHVKLMPAKGNPVYDEILGRQYEAAGRPAEARPLLEKARAENAFTADAALALARIYDQAGEYPSEAALLEPFLAEGTDSSFELWTMAAGARLKNGNFAEALDILDRAMARFGVNTVLLNLSGDAYLGQGRPAEAKAAWERSMSLNTDQPEIKAKLGALKSPGPVPV